MVDSLNAALSGLRAAQRQISLISVNIANATTPGYTRKILPQTGLVVGGIAMGVDFDNIRRNVNESLQFDFYAQTSLSGTSGAQMKYLREIQLFHGDPNDENALPNMLQSIGNKFRALSDSPTDPELLATTVTGAQQFATRINDLSQLYTRLRNDVQTEMQETVRTINQLTSSINDLNNLIVRNKNIGRATADVEDQRDLAIAQLSKEIDISYYETGEGRLIVQTDDGEALVDTNYREMVFQPSTLGVDSYYPVSAAGIYLDNPTTASLQDFEITQRRIGGRLGGLLEMRDGTLPQYQAELDEFAQKIAQRFDEQGLRLFTDNFGVVPDNVAPPANTNYSGFSENMQVNTDVVGDPDFLRLGTYGETLAVGSNLIIDRIVSYTFGNIRGQSAVGTNDISGVTDLFTQLGLDTQAKVQGLKDIVALGALDSSSAIEPGVTDTFSIALGAGLPTDFTIGAGDTAADLVNLINTTYPGLASLSATGRLVLQDDENIVIGAGSLGTEGLDALGLTAGTTNAQNPSFTVQLDDQTAVTITIAPTDTNVQLLAQLNAVPGLNAQLNGTTGVLELTTDYGAKIKLTNGSFGDVLGQLGMSVTNIAHTAFRTDNLGPGADIGSDIRAADTLLSYGQRVVSSQAGGAATAQNDYDVAETYRATIEQQLLNESGVNLDEEMGNLVLYQQIYGANAKMISTTLKMLDDLLAVI